MLRRLSVLGPFVVVGCSYGPAPEQATPCSTANAQRLEARRELASGSIGAALNTIEAANAACPTSRSATRAEEVKLLAELGRCGDARNFAATIEADPDRSDGAWLAASAARGSCDRDAGAPPKIETLLTRARAAAAAGDVSGARTAWDRAIALARASGLAVVADCTRWAHKSSYVGAWLHPLDAFVLLDGSRALALRATDGHEVRSFDAGAEITFVSASSDGRTLATATEHEIVVWSIDHALPVARWAGAGPISVSADGKRVAYVEGNTVVVHGDTLPPIPVHGGGELTGLHLGDDAIAWVQGDALHVVARTGRELWQQGDLAGSIVGARDGAYYVQSGSSLGYIAYRVTRTTRTQLGDALAQSIAIDVEGKRYAAEKWIDDGNGGSHSTAVLVDETSGKQSPLDISNYRAFMAHGRIANLGIRDDISIYDATSGRLQLHLASPSAKLSEVRVSEDGSTLLFGFILELLSFNTWSVAFSSAGAARLASAQAWAMAITPDGTVALGPRHEELVLWSTRTGALIGKTKLDPPIDTEHTPFLSPSRRWFVAKTKNGGWQRRDLTGTLPPASIPSTVVRFDEDDTLVVDDIDLVALDPATLAPQKNRKPARHEDAMRLCRNGVATECVDFVQSGVGPGTQRDFAWVDKSGSRAPLPGRAGHTPFPWANAPADGRWVALTYADGALTLHPPHGGPGIELRVFPDGSGAYARSPDGHLELFGDAKSRAVCRIGAFSEPIEACESLLGPVVTPLLQPAKLTP